MQAGEEPSERERCVKHGVPEERHSQGETSSDALDDEL